jgi:hypothetical protein
MDKTRIGMIGSGFAARLHLNNLAKLRGLKAEVMGISSLDTDLADVAKRYDIPDYYLDYRRLLERKDIDIIDICVPTDLHAEFCMDAARAGKHVICEKPLTGYFGKDRAEEHVGFAVSKELMLRETLQGCELVAKAANVKVAVITGRDADQGIRFEKARELGVDYTVNVDRTGPLQKVLEVTDGLGVDMLVETSGGERAIAQAFEMVRRLGRICAIGISGKEAVAIPYDRGIFKALRYDFCFSSSWTAWERMIGLIAKGALPAEKLIAHRLPLEDWEHAFRLLEGLQAAKVILIP